MMATKNALRRLHPVRQWSDHISVQVGGDVKPCQSINQSQCRWMAPAPAST